MFCRNPASQRALDLVKKKKKKDVIHCCYEIIIVYFYHKKYFMLRLQSKLQRLYLKLSLPKKCPNTVFFLVGIVLYSDWARRFTE